MDILVGVLFFLFIGFLLVVLGFEIHMLYTIVKKAMIDEFDDEVLNYDEAFDYKKSKKS